MIIISENYFWDIYLRNISEICIWEIYLNNIFGKYIRELKCKYNMTLIAEICHFAQTNQPSIEGSIECRIVQKASFPLHHGSFGYISTVDPNILEMDYTTWKIWKAYLETGVRWCRDCNFCVWFLSCIHQVFKFKKNEKKNVRKYL